MMIYYSTLLIAMFLSMVLIPIFKSLALSLHAMDQPSPRKVHQVPMPKTGGIAMAIGAVIPLLLWMPLDQLGGPTLIGAGIIVFSGFLDDIKDLGYKTKFAAQLVAVLIVILVGGVKITNLGMLLPEGFLLPNYVSVPLTLIFIVGVTNAINLADGLDGLAGGISLLTFICISYLAYLGELTSIALISLALIGAIFGFLRFNSYPAKVFMGDAGSQLIGFLAGTLSVALSQGNAPLSPLLPLLIVGFPVLDTITVMFERIAKGRSPFVADKRHFHHKLMDLGFFHTEAVLIIYVMQAFLVTTAFVFRFYSDWLLLGIYLAFSGIILYCFWLTGRKGWKIERHDFVDKIIKGKLKILKKKNILIKSSFRVFNFGIPLLYLFSSFLPESVPKYLSLIAAGLLIATIVAWVFFLKWLAMTIRIGWYFTIPLVIFFSEIDMCQWMSGLMEHLYMIFFGFMVFVLMLTIKYTRRKKGFKASPMDFLIFFVAVAVPNLPDPRIQSLELGAVAVKIIVLFFSCEVLIGELRGKLNWIGSVTLIALAVLAFRGLVV